MGSSLSVDERGVATYTIDEAATRNALSVNVLADVVDSLRQLGDDDGVRAIVFTGAGEIFSSGADRTELGDPGAVHRATMLLTSVLTLVDESPVPVVCRVNGPAFGAGLAVVAAADIAVASEHAFFALPEVRFGLVAGPAAAACLGRIGQSAALDVLLTGRRFAAPDAERMGLIAKVVRRDELDETVEAVVTDLLLADPAAVTATRRLVRRMTSPTLVERLRLTAAAHDRAGPR